MLILQRPLKSSVIKSIWKEWEKGAGGAGIVKNYFSAKKVLSQKVLFVTPPSTPSHHISFSLLPPPHRHNQNKNEPKNCDSSNCSERGWIWYRTLCSNPSPPPPRTLQTNKQKDRDGELWSVLLGVKLCGVSCVVPLKGFAGEGGVIDCDVTPLLMLVGPHAARVLCGS
jgi:hypothetical protein